MIRYRKRLLLILAPLISVPNPGFARTPVTIRPQAGYGYFDCLDGGSNPIGLVANIGWAPGWDSLIRSFIPYRYDLIFAETTNAVYSLSMGASYTF
jgi:hypothetical protein